MLLVRGMTMTVDLTGLPEPIAEDIIRLVSNLRRKFCHSESRTSERKPLLGRFADLKISIPKEAIDEAQREAWAGFPRDLPDAKKP
jgi:hypothetical protein